MPNDSECSAGVEVNLFPEQSSIPVTINLLLQRHYTIMIPCITDLHSVKKQMHQMLFFFFFLQFVSTFWVTGSY